MILDYYFFSKMPYNEASLFTALVRMEGSIQLYNSGKQVYELSNEKYKKYYSRRINYHKEMISALSKIISVKGTVEEISSKEIPIIDSLLEFPPYLEYLKRKIE